MQKFSVKKKAGFTCFDSVVKVYDANGILFYYKENKEGKKIHFNLPKGIYLTNSNLNNSSFRKYKLQHLPKPNNPKKLPKNFTIIYTMNPHKCSVDNRRHIIYFDVSFKNKPIPVKDYVKFHELGHYFYSGQGQRSEICCDVFASNVMLSIGYNPSQVRWAQHGTLGKSETSEERKEKVFNHLKKSFI